MLCQSFEVLDGSGEEELIAGTGEAPQSEPDHREDVFSLAEEPLDLLALDTGDPTGLALHERLGVVASFLVYISREAALLTGGARWCKGGLSGQRAQSLRLAMYLIVVPS